MSLVTVLATGGTIATRADARGVSTAQDSGADLLARLPGTHHPRLRVRDVLRVGSYRMTLELAHAVALAVGEELADPEVDGVVVTHGTDTTEETGYLLDLFHRDPRPVVLTGAQRPADAPDGDGPRNLADAVTVAASPAAREQGVLVAFAGRVFPARGTRKVHTLAADAFGAPDSGPLGWVRDGVLHVERAVRRREPLDLARFDPAGVRVDVVACHPDADATALHAFAGAGARGLVLEATGAGNANPGICRAVRELTDAGLVVATSTRVPAGPVAALYGDGGGTDLLAAGALPAGLLRPSQARVLLAVLLGVHRDPDAVRAGWRAHTSG
ncbi:MULTISPECIES: asparaginase [unclassified Geodermatophilus]